MSPAILVVAGSTRTQALSKQLARAVCGSIEQLGAAPTFVDLRDYPMPLYDGDLEAAEGLPEAAVRLRQLVQQHQAFVFVTPEYNASLPAVLKNALDWLSRPYAKEPGVSPLRQRVAALLSSSPGALGGQRALVHLRAVLMNLGMLVLTEQFALGNADRAFAADGGLVDGKQVETIRGILRRLVHVASRLAD